MISEVKIRANRREMYNLVKSNSQFKIKYYEGLGRCLFKAIIDHRELDTPLNGVFSITRLHDMLSY